jgi:hypothetical protein
MYGSNIFQLKKSVKYILIIAANFIILASLLYVWTDKLEIAINPEKRIFEFLKIIAITIIIAICLVILTYIFRMKNIDNRKLKVILAISVCILISSFLYIDYTVRVFNNFIVNRRIRNEIANKIKPSTGLAYGINVTNLSREEYFICEDALHLPSIPIEASSINCIYEYDGLLPDYFLSISYNLPLNIQIDTFHISKNDFTKSQTCEINNNCKKITYTEDLR